MNVKLGGFALSILLVISSWLYFTRNNRRVLSKQQAAAKNVDYTQHQTTFLSTIIALHGVYILYRIFFCGPKNMFSILNLPYNSSSDLVRRTLLEVAGDEVEELPVELEMLLQRLNSFDARIRYIRFGHDTLLKCQHCASFYDYAIFALPRPLLEYVREVAIVGFITNRRSGRLGWRKFAVGVLVMAALAEGYITLTKALTLGDDRSLIEARLHEMLWLGRQILFLLIPPILLLLPSSFVSTALTASLPRLAILMDQTLARINLLKYTHNSAARNPVLRTKVTSWWEQDRREGEWAIADDELQALAASNGMGFSGGDQGIEPGELRKRARMAVEGLKGGFKLS